MLRRLATIRQAIAAKWVLWVGIALGFPVLFQAAQLAALVLKFGDMPNYWTLYDWPRNVSRILASTPSLTDSLFIIADEWLLEIGYMNRDFGHGISEWALNVLPANVASVLLLSMLLATALVLVLHCRECGFATRRATSGAAGAGVSFVALTSITMSWVVCCSTPSWIVGLSMMGLSVPLSLWIEPVGPWLSIAGFMLLATAIFVAASPEEGEASTGADDHLFARHDLSDPRGLHS